MQFSRLTIAYNVLQRNVPRRSGTAGDAAKSRQLAVVHAARSAAPLTLPYHGGGEDDDPAGSTAAGQERREKLTEETDDLLDEIDDVLEENAEDFVRAYVQKGGQ